MKRSEISTLIKELNQQFVDEISNLPFKPKVREDLKAGFADGARSMLMALIQKGEVKIEED